MFIVDGSINNRTVRRLAKYVREHVGSVFHVYINSPGGCTRSAFAIFEIFRTVSASGKKVVVQGVDEIYSSALILFLGGDDRYATAHTRFLIHEVTLEEQRVLDANSYKKTGADLEAESTILFDLIKSRTKLTLSTIKRKVKTAPEKDWYFDVNDAERFGIVTHLGFALIPRPKNASAELTAADFEADA